MRGSGTAGGTGGGGQRVGGVVVAGGPPGEGQEDVVEGGPPQSQVHRDDLGGIQGAQGRHQVGNRVADRDGDLGAGLVDDRRAAADAGQRRRGPVQLGGAHLYRDQVAAEPGLELSGGAGGDHLAPVDDDAVVRELVGFFQVLGGEQHGGTPGHQIADERPHVQPGAGIEPGGRLVQDQHPGPAD